MFVLFLAIALVAAILYFKSKALYIMEIEQIDSNKYRLKKFIPIGLYVLEISNYSFKIKYDRRLYSKIAELYGVNNAFFNLKIHTANKLICTSAGLLILIFFGIFTEIGPEYFAFCIMILIVIFLYCDNEISRKLNERRLKIQIQFPDFLNKLTLLINAGMTMSGAMEKIIYQNTKDGDLYDELRTTVSEIKSGKSEIKAYEDFAKRCRTTEITKFVSVILQNLKKGNAEVVSILRLQSGECWEMRKNTAKKLGEEASTKLLLPMMIIFLAILIIVITPAMLSMQGI